ncbi:hypothetical protein LR013_03630 [candidate division NPL-UPA2 bacterium]|nr:hypothetical protein [candidate division NPL-UPA2 bacterium]
MALKGRTKLVQSKHAKTQYVAIPATIVADSQYPFKKEEDVEIIIDPDHKILMIATKGTSIEISGNKISVKGKKGE